jgi:hypothetical protein
MNPVASPFSPAEMADFEQQARRLNSEGRGDQAAFYLRPRAEHADGATHSAAAPAGYR